jgi:hypothetical protein
MSDPNGPSVGAEIELPSVNNSNYAVVPTEEGMEGKTSLDLTWVNLNFKVNDKNILTKCWGKVSLSPLVLCGPCLNILFF